MSSVSSSLKTFQEKIVLPLIETSVAPTVGTDDSPQTRHRSQPKTKQKVKYGTGFTDFRRDASALKKCHLLKNKTLRSVRLRNGRLREGGARRWGTWTSVLLGAAAAACHHVSQAVEECAAKHRDTSELNHTWSTERVSGRGQRVPLRRTSRDQDHGGASLEASVVAFQGCRPSQRHYH